MNPSQTIHIFKTDIKTPEDKGRLQAVLDRHEDVETWHIDQEDIDCVLRIVSRSASPTQIIDLLHTQGYRCSELA